MKKLIMVLVLGIALVSSAFAADVFEKGNIDFSGSMSFTSSNGDLYDVNDEGRSSFYFGPSAGYFVMDNLSVGLGLGFNTSSQGDASSSGLSFGPRVNYYLNQMGPGYPFAQLGITMASSTSNSGMAGAQDNKYSYTYIGMGVGYIYFLNDKIGAIGTINYDMNSEKMKEPVELDSESGTQLSFRIGFRMFL